MSFNAALLTLRKKSLPLTPPLGRCFGGGGGISSTFFSTAPAARSIASASAMTSRNIASVTIGNSSTDTSAGERSVHT
jgi:hypothetical protein